MKELLYRQCILRKTLESGHSEQTSWLPDQFAKVGMVLQIREDEIWENGWRVIKVGSEMRRGEFLPEFSVQKRMHRKNTGDSLPK